ncbi:hypothetical protein JA1_005031 [Spathaspora sp. JA1]|nr:hypothetical protein JA1_005031 [Spathaspora sp. JA1]
MSGVKFTLKKKTKLKPKQNILNQAPETQSDKLEIQTYDISKPKPKPKLIIKPDIISNKIVNKLNYGITKFDKTTSVNTNSTISNVEIEDSDEEFEKVPIEQFGIGFLRGLGYDEEEEPEEPEHKEVNDHRSRGVTLGIGADPIAQDLAQELNKGIPELPLLKRRKKDQSE